jgi:cation:H+ antiporter
MITLLIVSGAIMLPLGANLLIDGAVGIGERFGLSNQVIGLTVVALSTSAPELATTLVAAVKRQADVAVGNVIGSNVLNILGIMGAASLASLRELAVPAHLMSFDIPVMLAGAILLTVVTIRKMSIGRRLGGAMLGIYLMYFFLVMTGRA